MVFLFEFEYMERFSNQQGVIERLLCRRTSLTPLNYLYIIQKYSSLDEDQFTLKDVDLGVPSNEARTHTSLMN